MDTRVKDWLTEAGETDRQLSPRELRRATLQVVAALATVWLLLFAISSAFPYVENGASSVGALKFDIARRPALFDGGDKVRVFFFGNSQVLAGFEPDVFDERAGRDVAAVNLAIPGEDRYVDLLETALKAGNVPTHVLVQALPRRVERVPLWDTILDNKRMIELLFPFKDYVRDSVIFAFEARGPAGFARQYASNAAQIARVENDRGYYFIKSQSHYPDDALPADYALPTDRPGDVLQRTVDTANPEFKRLVALADTYGFRIVVVPVAFRRGNYAEPAATDPALARTLTPFPRLQVAGPPYLLMEPRFFSDPLHLNPAGARLYTEAVAGIFHDAVARSN